LTFIICTGGETWKAQQQQSALEKAGMDIVVTRTPDPRPVWTLVDRLGRRVGQITQFAESQFVISAHNTSPAAPLSALDATHKSLSDAMDAIAQHMKGVCQFSHEEDQ
jgi:hypothetical protein